jgi:hypothetical protein
MEGRPASSDGLRVVVLSRDPQLGLGLADHCASPIALTRAPSGYEAAAEILALPVSALVVDFRAFGASHRRLLEIARQMDVDVLGVGALPGGMDSEDLDGVRLVSRRALAGALDRLAAAAGADVPPQPRPTPTAAAPRAATTEERDEQPPASRDDAEPPDQAEGEVEAQPEAETQPSRAQTPGELLTPEEISALLEDEP